MLYTYSTNISVGANELIPFNVNEILTGCVATHVAGTAPISLNKCGFYKFDFNITATPTTGTGVISVEARKGGELIDGAQGSETVGTAADLVNIAFSAIVRVLPNCCAMNRNVPVDLTFANTGVAIDITNVAVDVTKIA